MKKKIMSLYTLFIIVLWSGMIFQNGICADDMTVQSNNKNLKKRPVTSSRHRKGKSPKAADVQKEEPIENMEAFVKEFDLVAKKKLVDALLARGLDFCKNNTLEAIGYAFTRTKDFIEGGLYLFLIDTKGVVFAHGGQSSLLWKNLWNRKDMFGSYFVQSMIKAAHSGGDSLTYEWDGAVKVSSIARVDIAGKEFVLGCGYYPHSKEYAAVGLVKGAVALFYQYVKEEKLNPEVAFSDMSYPLSSQFIFGDLYLYALDFNGKIVAQGERAGLIGSNALEYADAAGKKYNKDFISLLANKEAGEGVWVDYISKHAPKRAYAERVTDEKDNNYFIACGYYPDITKDTTINLVRRGYQFMKSNGVSVALQAFGDEQDDAYRYGDLGLFVYDMKGTCLAHGKNRDLIGQNLFDLKDPDGRYFVRELINQANAGGGWVNFKNNNSFQSTYIEKIDMGVGEYVIGAGMFAVSKPETMELLVKSTLAYLTNNSMEQFLERLVNRNDEFLRGDLFMYVFDLNGVCYGWADNYTLIWQQLINWRDENGKPFVKQMIESSSKGPDHLVLTMNKRPRVNYFEQIEKDGKKYLVGSGFYK